MTDLIEKVAIAIHDEELLGRGYSWEDYRESAQAAIKTVLEEMLTENVPIFNECIRAFAESHDIKLDEPNG